MELEKYDFQWDENGHKASQVLMKYQKAIDFYGLHGWKAEINSRAKRRGGCCKPRKKVLDVSAWLVRKNGFRRIENTILHEIAHAIEYNEYGKTDHGPRWQRIARAIGCDGKRCFTSDNTELPEPKYYLVCPNCGKKSRRHRKPKASYACGTCCTNGYDEKYKLILQQNH